MSRGLAGLGCVTILSLQHQPGFAGCHWAPKCCTLNEAREVFVTWRLVF